jgi:hypothetical protein
MLACPSSHIYKTEMLHGVIDVDANHCVINVDADDCHDCVIDVDADENILEVYAPGPTLDYLLEMASNEADRLAEHEMRVGNAWDAQFGHCFPDLTVALKPLTTHTVFS